VAPPLPANLRPLMTVFWEWQKRLRDSDVAYSEFTRAWIEGRLIIVQYVDGKLRTVPQKRTRIDRDPADALSPAVFVDDTVQAGAFYVGEPAGGNEVETKNIFEPGETPRALSGKGEKRGRKPIHKWGEIRVEIVRLIFNNGRPAYPDNVSELAGKVGVWCIKKYKKAPDDGDLRREITAIVAQLKAWFE
jgi:hypothetical protein